jgi:RNA polymerase sigma factor (sigma-70 family)
MLEENRSEIRAEAQRKFIARRRRKAMQAWCAACAQMRTMVALEEIASLSGATARKAGRQAPHYLESPEGMLLVCLNSLSLKNAARGEIATNDLQPFSNPQVRPFDSLQSELNLPGSSYDRSALGKRRKRNWALTAEAFEKLLNFLNPDATHKGQSYERVRQKLIKYFECRGCLFSEDLADETINRVARRIEEGKEILVSDPIFYFYGVARNVIREYWNSPERGASSTERLIEFAHPLDCRQSDEAEAQEQKMNIEVRALEQCLEMISPENREIIIRYFQGEKGSRIRNRKHLADELGIPPNALRIRIHRIREKLELMVKDRVKQLEESQTNSESPRQTKGSD